ncbi:uncharacterized protein LOC142349623 [Convolutriloba macropyga]|uniref:uncharacterized protein LOC142349623 n=1 Tax=Convolutriloba macropyga TaxID=536237 RepID=UPI003F525938
MADGGGPGSGSNPRVPRIDLSGLNTSNISLDSSPMTANTPSGFDETDSSAAFKDLPRNIRDMNRKYKHHLEERDVEIKNLRKQLNEDTRMLKYEYDQLLENERRKARSDLTDLRSSLEKAKREEIDKGSILFLPSPSQPSPV